MNATTRCAAPGALRLPIAVLACLGLSIVGRAQNLTIYDDALQNSFLDYSYGGQPGDIDFASTVAVHGGIHSISMVGDSFNAMCVAHPSQSFTTAQYPTLHFWVHGGTVGNQQLRVYLELNNVVVAQAELDTYIAGGVIAAGVWREVTVNLGQAPLSYSGSFDRIDLQSDVAGVQPVLSMDDMSLVPPSGGGNPLLIEHDVTVGSMVSDRFTWRDGANQQRVAVLAHNDGQVGPGGVRGGAMREFRYQLPDGTTRVASVTTYGNGGYGGFGYVVAHASHYVGCVGDDSPLGDFFPGQFQRVFEGRHHVIFRFTQNYVRNCSTTAPVISRTLPVTIDWVFSTGHDNPLWAITYDVDLAGPQAPVDTFWDDARAPYGELNIDGDGWTDIDGVAWGDRWKFKSTTAPVTLDSQWTWNVPNTVPYVKLWLAGPLTASDTKDATMGIVQTQTMTQQDAAGGRDPSYHDMTAYWNKTSASGNAGGTYAMPYQDDWPYQANAFSIGVGVSSNNARLTWRTQWGFLGQQSYVVNDGVVTTAPGYPKKSYSTYVVLGTHTSSPVESQVTQVETVQSMVLSATIGNVVTSGPAGVGRADTVNYAPAGYNHVYGALAFNASGNRLDANVSVGSGSLKKPLVIVGSYSGGAPTVKLGGTVLTADVDYFASLRPSPANELWITLDRDLGGPTNHLEINPNGTSPLDEILTGPGPGPSNTPQVKVWDHGNPPIAVATWTAYGAGGYGVNVASADITGAPGVAEVLTGPGPGAVYGPQVRAFQATGVSMAKVNFYAYGTLKYGVNVAAGDVESDGFAEILSGAGPGAVFGPHVRGFNFDNSAVTAMPALSFYAYSTLKYGVNVASGSLDADAPSEIVTIPGPGAVFAPTVRGFNWDGGPLSTINKINFNAFSVAGYGGRIAALDVDADGFAELAVARGPSSSFDEEVRSYNFDATAVTMQFSVNAYPSLSYGCHVGGADVNGDGGDELLAGPGPGPANFGHASGYHWNGTAASVLVPDFSAYGTFLYGANPSGGEMGSI